ncbi:hypothetical protein BJV77DRAFT_170493 [Russula vinacea]|nr:hypothetical protein BJV77DRAFT_170493 [Russula vinacea]
MRNFTSGWSHTHSIHLRGYLSILLAIYGTHANLCILSLSGLRGPPVNDTADYVVIRDDWLWSRSLSLAMLRTFQRKHSLDPCGHIQCEWEIACSRPIDMVGKCASILARTS